jgi:hypothetical protein
LQQEKAAFSTLQVSTSLDNSENSETAWGPLISLTVRTSAPRPRRRCPDHGCHSCFAAHSFAAAIHAAVSPTTIASHGFKESVQGRRCPPFCLSATLHGLFCSSAPCALPLLHTIDRLSKPPEGRPKAPPPRRLPRSGGEATPSACL